MRQPKTAFCQVQEGSVVLENSTRVSLVPRRNGVPYAPSSMSMPSTVQSRASHNSIPSMAKQLEASQPSMTVTSLPPGLSLPQPHRPAHADCKPQPKPNAPHAPMAAPAAAIAPAAATAPTQADTVTLDSPVGSATLPAQGTSRPALRGFCLSTSELSFCRFLPVWRSAKALTAFEDAFWRQEGTLQSRLIGVFSSWSAQDSEGMAKLQAVALQLQTSQSQGKCETYNRFVQQCGSLKEETSQHGVSGDSGPSEGLTPTVFRVVCSTSVLCMGVRLLFSLCTC